VADRVNFDIKKRMYARFSMGVAAYLVARVCKCQPRAKGGELTVRHASTTATCTFGDS
jgi:putative component of membrane protein insertase Oxa1/YidC/SpoIIIJ protein YidD